MRCSSLSSAILVSTRRLITFAQSSLFKNIPSATVFLVFKNFYLSLFHFLLFPAFSSPEPPFLLVAWSEKRHFKPVDEWLWGRECIPSGRPKGRSGDVKILIAFPWTFPVPFDFGPEVSESLVEWKASPLPKGNISTWWRTSVHCSSP